MSKKQFKIICLETGEPYHEWGEPDEPMLYESGKEAEKVARALSDETQQKWQVRPHIVDNSWREREAKRFYDGVYYPVPWDSEDWYLRSPYWAKHFAHVSVKNDVRIAFTPNETDGLADKQTRIKPGRYLEQFFGDYLSSDDIREYASYFSILHEDIQVKFAKTADEIQTVYMSGPKSCMDGAHYRKGIFKVPFHPVRMYEGPDLAVAYLERDKEDIRAKVCDYCSHLTLGCDNRRGCGTGRFDDPLYNARSVVWPEKKLFSTVYGDVDRLRLALEREGYKSGSLEGAKISRYPYIVIPGKPGFVVPYIDSTKNVSDDGKHIVLDKDGPFVTSQYGYVYDNRKKCPECSQHYRGDGYNVLNAAANGHDALCEPCYAKGRFVECASTGYRVRVKDAICTDFGAVHKVHMCAKIGLCPQTKMWIWLADSSDATKMADGSFVSTRWFNEQGGKKCTRCRCGYPATGAFVCKMNSACYSKPEWTHKNYDVWHTSQVGDRAAHTWMTYAEALEKQKEARLERDRLYSIKLAEEAKLREEKRQADIRATRRRAQQARRLREREQLARTRNGVPV